VKTSSCKVTVILFGFLGNLNILDRFSNTAQLPSFIKIRPVGAELFRAKGQTDRQTDGRTERQTDKPKLTVAFNNLANAPKDEKAYTLIDLAKPEDRNIQQKEAEKILNKRDCT
jgi:hypothetical protein